MKFRPAPIPMLAATLVLCFAVSREIYAAQQNPAAKNIQKNINNLKHADSRVRAKAAYELGKAGNMVQKDAFMPLMELCEDKDPWVRACVAASLASVGPDPVPWLAGAACDADSLVRAVAGEAIIERGTNFMPDLAEAAKASNEEERENILEKAGGFGSSILGIVQDVTGKDLEVAEKAVDAAEKVGSEGVSGAIDVVRDEGIIPEKVTEAADKAKDVAGRMEEVGVDVKKLAKPKEKTKPPAAPQAPAAPRFGKKDIPAFIKALDGSEPLMRPIAAAALAEIGQPAVKDLQKTLGDSGPSARALAASVLGKIGVPAKETAPALALLLKDGDAGVRWSAVNALGKLGAAARDCIPALTAALKDGSVGVQCAAADALEKIGAPTRRSGTLEVPEGRGAP